MTDPIAQAHAAVAERVAAARARGHVPAPPDGTCSKCGQDSPNGCPIAAEDGLCRWDFSRRAS